jgi:hypothetical protein
MEGYGAKVGATGIIWGFATGMLAICIPLVSITKSGAILPLVTLLGASGSTVAVWRSSRKHSATTVELLDHVKALNKRIETLEAICASEGFEFSENSQQLEPHSFTRSQTPGKHAKLDAPKGETHR